MLRHTRLANVRALAVAGLMVFSGLALGCEANGSYSSSAAGPTSQLTESDRAFALKVAAGGRHEVELGRLAADRASDADVKAFANRMIQDHSQAGDELLQITTRLGISVAPESAENQGVFTQLVDRLSNLNGLEFDRAYMSAMLEDHMQDAPEIESYANNGNNSELKSWALKTAPVVREHLRIAQGIAARLGALPE